MSSWPLARIEQCAEIVSGATPSTTKSEYWDGDIYWATPKDLSELEGAYLSDTPRKITKRGLESCAATILPPNSVLFSSRAPIGHVAINTVPMATNQGFKSFVPRPDRLDPKFLYHWLRKNRAHLESLGNGATFKEVSKAVVSRIEIPLPPLPEQRRIVEILDKADALRAKRRAALAQLDTLTQSIFLDMFGDPATNPKGWRVGRLEDEITSVRYGTGSPPPYVDDGFPFIRATNIKAGTISAKDLKRISPDEAARIEKCRVHAGNLIIVRSGVNTGDCAIVSSKYDGAYAAFDLIVELPWANAVFYNFLINSPYGKAHLEPSTRRAAQPHLNAEQLRSLRFIAPDESRKQRFATLVSSIEKQKGRGDGHLRELDALFGALQHSAFRGEL